MKRVQTILFMLWGVVVCAAAADIPYSVYDYDIYYHCAFINDCAAHANVQVSCLDGRYSAILDGSSSPFGGRVYCINDTVVASFAPGSPGTPDTESVAYMSGFYRKPRVGHSVDLQSPCNFRTIGGEGFLSADHATIECVTLTADMLCMYYYARTVDFASMQPGQSVEVPVSMPDGSERTLQMAYQGVKDYNGRQVYSLTVNFTYGDGFSAYPITTYIDRELLAPVYFAASIAIGDVEMVYAY